jgi:hypothetical protein
MMKVNPKYESQFDDDRITDKDVSLEERCELEKKLIRMFVEKAAKEEKQIVLIYDPDKYRRLEESGDVFKGNKYYLLANKNNRVINLRPIVRNLLDTPEGLFYGKLMLRDECLPSSKH